MNKYEKLKNLMDNFKKEEKSFYINDFFALVAIFYLPIATIDFINHQTLSYLGILSLLLTINGLFLGPKNYYYSLMAKQKFFKKKKKIDAELSKVEIKD